MIRVTGICLGLVALASYGEAKQQPEHEAGNGKAVPAVITNIPERKFTVPNLPMRLPPMPNFSVRDQDMEAVRRLQKAVKELRLMEVWSLDPSIPPEDEAKKKSRPYRFHDWHSIGRAEFRDPAEVHEVILAVIRSIADAPDEVGECFDPRHGLRLYETTGFIDLVLCFACSQGVMHDRENEIWFALGQDAERKLDTLLRRSKIEKAP